MSTDDAATMMHLHLDLLAALGAAMAWGSADFCAKKASMRFGFWPTVWSMNAVGALALGCIWLAGAIPVAGAQLPRLAWLAVGNAVGGLCFYYALEFGPLVLVSPITAAYPVISAVLAYWLSGERLGPAVGGAVLGVILGTVLASLGSGDQGSSHPRRRTALIAAAASAIIFGSVFYALAAGAAASSSAAPVLVFRVVGATLLALPLAAGWRLPPALFGSVWVWASGLLDSLAYLFYAIAAHGLAVSVVSSLSGLFSIWTLVLAVIFLRERLSPRQWLGVALILGAVALLALK